MVRVVQLIMLVYFRGVLSVLPSHTSATMDMLQNEFGTMKNTIKILSDQWEKWNTLFITSLEPRITSTASTLASIDSNIHNLQERAHVWDTFQLHVTAWNEQLASLDRKMDIISKGQEEIQDLRDKINVVLNMEYKIDNTITLLNDVQDSITNLDTVINAKRTNDVLLNEFAARGVLSSIKLVERKLDRLLIANQNNIVKAKINVEKPKFTIKCNVTKTLEEVINDISSKVDLIFDSISSVRDEDTDTDFDDYLNIEEGSGIDTVKNKLLTKSRRKIMMSCKHNNQILEEVLKRAVRIENTSLIILDKENHNIQTLSKDNTERNLLDNIHCYFDEFTKNNNLVLESYFKEQKAQFEGIAHNLAEKSCGSTFNHNFATIRPTIKYEPSFTEHLFEGTTASSAFFDDRVETQNSLEINDPQPTWIPIVNQNKSSCEDLNTDAISGVYIFENNSGGKSSELFFNKRYCEIRKNGLWTVIQRRDNYLVQNNFNASWNEYKYGFGDLHKDFWIGNEFLWKFSNSFNLTLRIELEDFDNQSTWAEYSIFRISSENDNYRLTIGGYTGNATDSFSGHNGSQFSTFDRINDEAPECCPCAVSYGSGWWYNRCFESNLNGVYYRRPHENNYYRGIIWEHWLGNYSLKKTVMMVAPHSNANSKNSPQLNFRTAKKYLIMKIHD